MVPTPICERCGAPLSPNRVCLRCRQTPLVCDRARSLYAYQGEVRKAIHHLKYQRDLCLSLVFGQALSAELGRLDWQPALVTSVPLSPSRRSERGFNQADLLAQSLAMASGLRFRPRALRRIRETASQVGLSLKERRQNVWGAFQADRRLVAGREVLVVDDLMTTGATLDACAQALREADAERVYALTLARTLLEG
jgi:competence protein ComFC